MFLWPWYWNSGFLSPPVDEEEEDEEFGGHTAIWSPFIGRTLEEDEAIFLAAIL